jgi:hypothetical protein
MRQRYFQQLAVFNAQIRVARDASLECTSFKSIKIESALPQLHQTGKEGVRGPSTVLASHQHLQPLLLTLLIRGKCQRSKFCKKGFWRMKKDLKDEKEILHNVPRSIRSDTTME